MIKKLMNIIRHFICDFIISSILNFFSKLLILFFIIKHIYINYLKKNNIINYGFRKNK